MTEVHVVAQPGKRPKQIVRDVQSIALASFGLEIDRRIVSVVQLGGGPEGNTIGGQPAVDRRHHGRGEWPALTRARHVAPRRRRGRRLRRGFDRDDRPPPARGDRNGDALRQLDPAAESIDIDHAQIVRVGQLDVAVVTVVFVMPPNEQVVAGSAIVRPQQEADAVARAVLDATNRRLAYLTRAKTKLSIISAEFRRTNRGARLNFWEALPYPRSDDEAGGFRDRTRAVCVLVRRMWRGRVRGRL